MSLNGHKLQELPGNDFCVDCQDCDCEHCGGFPDPVWASEELGILVCEDCMDIHKSLTKATFKSVLCQDWTEESLNRLLATNNKEVNQKYEKYLPVAYRKPTRCFDRTFREQWIIAKYVRQDFAKGPEKQPRYLIGMKKAYMWKRGRDDRIFQRRWFTLDMMGACALKYYADSLEIANLKRGEIPLGDLVVSPATEHKIGHPNGLQLMYPEVGKAKGDSSVRIIYIYAEAPKDLVEWYQAIRCLKYSIMKQRDPTQDDKKILQKLCAEVVTEGYLMKTGSSGKEAFRKRWFILDKEKLMYFKKQLDANPISAIKLGSHKQGYSLVQSNGDNGSHFYLRTPRRIYHLIAEQPSERDRWIKAIHRVCHYLGNIQHDDGHYSRDLNISQPRLTAASQSARSTSEPAEDKLLLRSSATLPAHSSDLLAKDTEDSPAVPPRPFINVRDSLDMHRKHNKNENHQHFHDAKYHEPHHKHPPKILFDHNTASQQDDEDDLGDHDDKDSTDDNGGYITYDQLEVALKNRVDGIPDGECSQQSEDCFLDEDEDPYMEFVEEKVVCTNQFTKLGGYSKQLSLQIRVAPETLSEEVRSTLSLSMVWNALPSMAGDSGCLALCPVVSCTSFPSDIILLKPISLEIQHCGVLKDINTCKPKLWCMRSGQGQFTWEAIMTGNSNISYQIKERSVIIRSKDVSVFAMKVPKDDIVGKTIRCATYTSSNREGNLNVRVYFINDNGSDDALQEIQRREQMYESVLCDVSHKFFLANNQDGIFMSVEDPHGLNNFDGSSDTIQVSAEDLWEKHFVCNNFELIQTAPDGFCTLKVWQENNPREKVPMELTLKTDRNKYFQADDSSPTISSAQQICEPHKPLTRVVSAPSDEEESESMLPFPLKRKLFLLLDPQDPEGNNWKKLATKLGLGAMISHIESKVNPTVEVLRYFETMGRTVGELEEYLRDMDRADAADVVSMFIKESGTQWQE